VPNAYPGFQHLPIVAKFNPVVAILHLCGHSHVAFQVLFFLATRLGPFKDNIQIIKRRIESKGSKVPRVDIPIPPPKPTLISPTHEAVQPSVVALVFRPSARVQVSGDALAESISIGTPDGGLHRLLEKGATLPLERQETFSATGENWELLEINVYQGDAPAPDRSLPNASYRIKSIIAPRGKIEIDVAFNVAGDGQLSAEARDVQRDEMLLVIAQWWGNYPPE
jgi:hypothetical protein